MRLSLLCIAIVSVLAGCSGSEEPPVTIEDFKGQYPKAYCEHLFRCCDGDERSYGSSLVCEQQVSERINELLGFTDGASAFAKFLPNVAKSCLTALRQTTCNDATLTELGCAEGTVEALHKEGAECTYSSECTTSYCVQPQKLVRGACGPREDLHCSGDDRACREGNACVNRECVLRKGTAQACGAANECQSGICNPTTKSCLPRTNPFCDGK